MHLQVRRFCKGMCYQDPVTQLAIEQGDDGPAEQSGPQTKRRRRAGGGRDEPSQTTKLSTDSGLSSFTPTSSVRNPKKTGKNTGNPEAFKGLPEAIRQYMIAEGYTAATPVQDRSVNGSPLSHPLIPGGAFASIVPTRTRPQQH